LKLFGFQIGTDKDKEQVDQNQVPTNKTFTLPQNDDGAVTIAGAGYYGTYVDLDGTFRNETQVITKYRELSIQPEMETALDEIVNEAIVHADDGKCVEINLDETNLPDQIKQRIEDEFEYILKLLNFSNMGHDIFRRWYIDGRLFYHIVIDETNPAAGVVELKYIDPRRIRKIREIQKMRDPQTGVDIIRKQVEYYMYNERGMLGSSNNLGARIAPDSIVNINSGLMDPKQTMVLSYLHKAIKPFNNLRMVEDAVVIYRLSRAPERRIFYIDVGNMPTVKADQYVRDIMVKYRNKLVYDSSTGELKDDRKHLSMLEDFWLPRREGSKGTEIDTLQGGQNLGQMDDVTYFQTKLYKALSVPISRLEQNTGFSLGRTTEITRDELKFTKFIQRLRNKFTTLFDEILRTQLVLKRVCTEQEWKEIKENVWYDFRKDNNFDELKETELLNIRIDTLTKMAPFVGTYYSQAWVRKNVLHQTDEDMAKMNQEMEQENAVAAQQQMAAQQQQMDMQAQQQQKDQENQLDMQAQGQVQQAVVQKKLTDKGLIPDEKEDKEDPKENDKARKHEAEMTDKKHEVEKLKAKTSLAKAKIDAKKVASKPAAEKKPAADKKPAPKKKKKTVSEEARELGLTYVGSGLYAKDQEITHQAENGILVPVKG